MSDRVVAFVVDAGYRMQLATALWSLAETNACELDAVAILSAGLSGTDRDRIEGPVRERLPIVWFDVDRSRMERVSIVGRLTIATCFKLFLAEILPRHWDRVVYMDADVLVLDSVAPLFDVELDGALLGAVRDPRSPWVASARIPWREMAVDPSIPTFNAGVLVVPLPIWRERDVARRAVEILERHRVPFVDQGALNVLAGGKWRRLPPRFNAQNGHFFNRDGSMVWTVERVCEVDAAVTSPAIVHFNGGNAGEVRPWEGDSVHPYAPHWLRALDQTDWVGWRPRARGRLHQVAVTARRRVAPAVRALRTG